MEFVKLLELRHVEGEVQTHFSYMLEKVLDNHFKNTQTGDILTLTSFYDQKINKKEGTISICYTLNNGKSGRFFFDYELMAFGLILDRNYSYVKNQLWLFRKLSEWGYIKF